jgi:hypothetical protein
VRQCGAVEQAWDLESQVCSGHSDCGPWFSQNMTRLFPEFFLATEVSRTPTGSKQLLLKEQVGS